MIDDSAVFATLGVTTTALTVWTTIAAARRRRIGVDLFSLIVPLGIWTALVFGVVPLLMLMLDRFDPSELRGWSEVVAWVGAGFMLFVVAYRYSPRIWPPVRKTRLVEEWDARRTFMAVAALWIAGMIGNYLFYSAVGGVEHYTQHLSGRVALWGKGLGPIRAMQDAGLSALIVWFAFVMHASHRRKFSPVLKWGVTIVLLLSTLLPTLPLGGRTDILRIFIHVMVIYHLLVRRIRPWQFALSGMLLLAFAYVYGEARMFVGRGGSTVNLRSMVEELPDRGVRPLLVEYEQYVTLCARIFDGVPNEVGYQLGRTYALGVVYFIPREIWTDKPDGQAAQLLSDVLYRGAWKGTSYITPTLWGEAFMNFGYLGLIVMPLIFGGMIGVLERSLLQAPVSSTHAALYALAYRWVDGLGIGDFNNVTTMLLVQAALLGAICYWLAKKKRGRLPTAQMRRVLAMEP